MLRSLILIIIHTNIDYTACEDLEKKIGVSCCFLLGELMYIYVTCCPDIGYSICCLIKFSTCPSEFYFDVLKNATIYLKCTSR